MISMRTAAAAAAAAVLLAACSSGPHGSSTAASGPSGAAGTAGASGPANGTGPAGQPGTNSPATGSPAGNAPGSAASSGRLTLRQADAAYVRIVQPGSKLADKLAGAASGTAPFSEFRTDALAYVKELRAEIGKFQAVRWPANVEARINAMARTDFPADISCLQAMSAAGSTAASQTVANSNHDCMVADNSTIPGTLPSLLSR